jgi:hypothetical protein
MKENKTNIVVRFLALVELITFNIWIVGPIMEFLVDTFDNMYRFVFLKPGRLWVHKVPLIGGFFKVAGQYTPPKYRDAPFRTIVVVYCAVLVLSTVVNLSRVRKEFWGLMFSMFTQTIRLPFDML